MWPPRTLFRVSLGVLFVDQVLRLLFSPIYQDQLRIETYNTPAAAGAFGLWLCIH